jgi:hypothetical protein
LTAKAGAEANEEAAAGNENLQMNLQKFGQHYRCKHEEKMIKKILLAITEMFLSQMFLTVHSDWPESRARKSTQTK